MLGRNRERERGAGVIWWAAVFSPPFCRAQQIHVLSLSRSLSAAASGAGVCVRKGGGCWIVNERHFIISPLLRSN